jgi:Trk-type K+ transport system membrane component
MAVDESDITELFESSEMQQILGSENTKKTRNGNIYFLINQINITAFIIYISGLLLAAGLGLN